MYIVTVRSSLHALQTLLAEQTRAMHAVAPISCRSFAQLTLRLAGISSGYMPDDAPCLLRCDMHNTQSLEHVIMTVKGAH